jgi:Ca-activated chloride channel family protein
MHLIAPWWLLYLLPLCGLIILLYLLKLRRRERVIPSVMLWDKLLQDLQANSPLQKLRKNLLLILQLLIVILIVIALTRPAMLWNTTSSRNMIMVIDASASMAARDVMPSRFELAQRRAHQAIDSLGKTDNMLIIAVGGGTRTLTPMTTDKKTLHDAINKLEVADTTGDLREAFDIAAGMARDKKFAGNGKPDMLVISDGGSNDVSLPTDFSLNVNYVKTGEKGGNVGIIAMDARRVAKKVNSYESFIVVKNFYTESKTFNVEILLNDSTMDVQEVKLSPGEKWSATIPDLPATGGILKANIDIDDALKTDNNAQIILPENSRLPVLLVSPGNIFLQTALSLTPGVQVTTNNYIPPVISPGTVVVADKVAVNRLPVGINSLLISCTGDAVPAEFKTTLNDVEVNDWDRRHPVLQHISLNDMLITQTSRLVPDAGAKSLIETASGVIAVTSETNNRRVIALGFDLHGTDFPLRVSFPIFIANCMEWLGGKRAGLIAMNIHAGETVKMSGNNLTLVAPNGKKRKIISTSAIKNIDGLIHTGIYQVTGDKNMRISVNLLNAGESDITPREKLVMHDITGKTINAATGNPQSETEFWRPILMLALMLLCIEWWVFHKRIG